MNRTEREIVVRGKFSDSSHIELDEPVSGFVGAVEITVRPYRAPEAGNPGALLRLLQSLPRLEPGAVDELEQSIEAGKIPIREDPVFGTDG